ncbi:MAG: hypothetical protein ABEI97_04780 [Candidatus Nanohaloarchaea archaeon]
MGSKRVPLYPDEEDDEPVTASADEIRENIDRSHLPDSEEEPERRRTRRRQQRSREEVEEQAVQRMVEKLREKGKSDEFIQEHMDEIRRRVRDELSR